MGNVANHMPTQLGIGMLTGVVASQPASWNSCTVSPTMPTKTMPSMTPVSTSIRL